MWNLVCRLLIYLQIVSEEQFFDAVKVRGFMYDWQIEQNQRIEINNDLR